MGEDHSNIKNAHTETPKDKQHTGLPVTHVISPGIKTKTKETGRAKNITTAHPLERQEPYADNTTFSFI